MGKIKTITDYLSESSFFEGMKDDHLELLSGCGGIQHFKPGDFLIKEGEEANSFYLILRGEIAVESYAPASGPIMLSRSGPGEVTGYSWLFPPHRNQFDSRALTKVDAIHLDGKCLRGKADNDYELGYHLMKRFAQLVLQRMHNTHRQMLNVYGTEQQVDTSGQ